MNYAPIRAITQDEIDTYENDGVVCLRQFFDNNTVELLREMAEENILNPSPMGDRRFSGGYWTFFLVIPLYGLTMHHLKNLFGAHQAADMAKAVS